jgi:DNA recombination protein Rad52
MFDEHQLKQLQAPIDPARIQQRSQAGRTLDYVASWDVIDTANRIFGFDGWDSDIKSLECIQEGPGRDEGKVSVSYLARVHISVKSHEDPSQRIYREDVGLGHGKNMNDIGDAHESAAKEAVSDAQKRALRTLGAQFGLSLYDKDRIKKETQYEKFAAFVAQEAQRIGDERTTAVLQAFGADGVMDVAMGDTETMRQIMQALKDTQPQEAA